MERCANPTQPARSTQVMGRRFPRPSNRNQQQRSLSLSELGRIYGSILATFVDIATVAQLSSPTPAGFIAAPLLWRGTGLAATSSLEVEVAAGDLLVMAPLIFHSSVAGEDSHALSTGRQKGFRAAGLLGREEGEGANVRDRPPKGPVPGSSRRLSLAAWLVPPCLRHSPAAGVRARRHLRSE
jgi:hypothetical protein